MHLLHDMLWTWVGQLLLGGGVAGCWEEGLQKDMYLELRKIHKEAHQG